MDHFLILYMPFLGEPGSVGLLTFYLFANTYKTANGLMRIKSAHREGNKFLLLYFGMNIDIWISDTSNIWSISLRASLLNHIVLWHIVARDVYCGSLQDMLAKSTGDSKTQGPMNCHKSLSREA
ncbi:hypothetical protein ACJX0J_037689 [Zea mays]